MDSDTVRNPDRGTTEAYWRRRALALGGGLSLIGLLAWACSGGDEKTAQRGPVQNAAALSSPNVSTLPTTMPTVTVTVTAKSPGRPVAPKKPGNSCDPRDVVLGFTATKDSYAGRDLPRFRVTAVNTGRRACAFGLGPKELVVRITSGSDRVWTSAQCARGSGSSVRLLRRGIPYVGTVVWDRRRSSAGCSRHRSVARPGTYVGAVKAGHIKVNKQVFRLR